MAGKPLNRLDLRRQREAAEPLDPMEDETDEVVEEVEEEEVVEKQAQEETEGAAQVEGQSPPGPPSRRRGCGSSGLS